jgi:hypothetical protein
MEPGRLKFVNNISGSVRTIIAVGLLLAAGLVSSEKAQAQDATQGCCEKVLKTSLKFEAEDMFQEPCEELKKDTEKYENVTYFPDKVALLGRCRSAADISDNASLPKFYQPNLSVNIPGLIRFTQPEFCKGSNNTKICISWLGQYIAALVNYATLVVGIVAAVTLMVGGVRWLTAAGNSSAVKDAKSWINHSLLGLALTLCAYILLVTINPALVSFSPIQLTWLEGLSLANNKTSGGACANGECSQIDQAVTNNSSGISGAFIKSMLVGGEGCNPANSTDGFGSCGYSQALPKYRISICGLKGDKSDCELFKRDVQADINCAAKFLMEQAPRCGNFSDIVKTASCYNSGSVSNCGTDDYCHRVEDYFKNKCGTTTTPPAAQ